MGDATVTGTRAQYQLNTLGWRGVTLSAAAEDTNVIDVTVQLVDAAGQSVSEAATLAAMVVGEPAADYTIAETGDGTEVSVTGHPGLVITTASDGDATISVTDVTGASGESVVLAVWVVGGPFATLSTVTLTFD